MQRHDAEALLKTAVADPDARFRDGQWEAIDALVNHRRKLMVVQRTGWGKSSVYFISTRILRDRGAGPTVIVSPLLALMRNQIEAAQRLGIHAETVNSTNTDDWPSIQAQILADEVDAILISPERLSNEKFVEEVSAAHSRSRWPVGRGRSPLHLRLGSRFPSGLPATRQCAAADAPEYAAPGYHSHCEQPGNRGCQSSAWEYRYSARLT